MNKRYTIYLSLLIITLLSTVGCTEEQGKRIFSDIVQAPASTIERDIRGHEMITAVQANLYYARMSRARVMHWGGRTNVFMGYGLGPFETPIPTQQTIEVNKNDRGEMVITSERKAFDVIKGEGIYYALELKYYDVNGQLINHQFSRYDQEDKDASLLEWHQTMFSIQTHALNGEQLTYPMTLDSLYIDRYLFGEERTKASIVSSRTVYLPEEYEAGSNTVPYNRELANKAMDVSMSNKATEPYTDPATGKTHYLYRTLSSTELNELAPEIFTYTYRDTDPVDMPLGKRLLQDDMNRERIGKPTGFLRQKRALQIAIPTDHLGFKGLLNFKQANMTFQMRVAICHIIDTGEGCQAPKCGKYVASTVAPFRPPQYNEIPASWNTYDLDYPLPFRVIADIDGDKSQFVKDIQKYYPNATEEELSKMFARHFSGAPNEPNQEENDYFRRIPFYRF